ncbi:bifunctional folylpolyglutamate synthase/dihydrofolate synthase [Candidatus Saganbacteria bacterium]|nr:bifunctional folylpolyglutamate synthase/dihydrofolate synthase [Candidatus Saganbacteria bacterium]
MLEFDTQNIKLGLDRVQTVLAKLSAPQNKFKSILVAGTNGKGSVCAMLASILKEAGFTTGLFTSPHLYKWNERIKINGKDISTRDLKRVTGEIEAAMGKVGLTPFEVITCAAFQYFAEQKVDMAVLEVGMGGRLDATNVITPLVSVITNVDYDHMEYLGDTLEKIAFEKAGIVKPKVPLVTAENKPEVLNVIRKTCEQKVAKLFIEPAPVKTGAVKNISPLIGPHQRSNETVAVKVSELLDIDKTAIKKGLQKTRWQGRFQIVSRKPLIIVDGAHNGAGARALVDTIKEQKIKGPLTFIVGMQDYKDSEAFLKVITPLADRLILARSSHPQAAKLGTLSVREALKQAKKFKNPIIITGSLFVVADALRQMGA